MKKLVLLSIINTVAMSFLIASRLTLENEVTDWILIAGIILIIATWVHFFWEKNKSDKLK